MIGHVHSFNYFRYCLTDEPCEMMNLFSSCLFSHASDPVLVIVKGVTRWECRRCQADLGEVLAGQSYKARKAKKAKKRATVLTLKRRTG